MEIWSLDPDILFPQISNMSRTMMPPMETLFSQWLSLPDTQHLVLSLLEDINAGAGSGDVGSISSPLVSFMQAASTPPLSPRGASGSSSFSPRSLQRISGFSSCTSPLRKSSEPTREIIPQFYFPNGPPVPTDISDQYNAQLDRLFSGHPLPVSAFLPITREVCELPSYLSHILFKKIDTNNMGLVSRELFSKYWLENNMLMLDLPARIFNILKQPEKNYLTQEDFRPILQELLLTHHGLDFLRETPEFQELYAGTVIHQIFYDVNRSGNGRMTLRELKRSNLVAMLLQVDEEKDINNVWKYFSYKHFYVIYCKFWELDTDHDFLIDKDDLLRYGNHSLTYRIIERIFSQAPKKFTSDVPGKMGYGDFVWFILSEEDKTSETSLEYWFKCIDLDCDGFLTRKEMQHFYEEQIHRMECMGQEPIHFHDMLCQMVDMIRPQNECMITLQDLKRCKLSGKLFNVLFNLKKFVTFESRDPILILQEREDPTLTEWDRFAYQEYIRISMDADGDGNRNEIIGASEENLKQCVRSLTMETNPSETLKVNQTNNQEEKDFVLRHSYKSENTEVHNNIDKLGNNELNFVSRCGNSRDRTLSNALCQLCDVLAQVFNY